MSEAENRPAFPTADMSFKNAVYPILTGGMSLRDWFAGQVIGSAALYAFADDKNAMRRDLLPEEWAAKIAWSVADAMLSARHPTQEQG